MSDEVMGPDYTRREAEAAERRAAYAAGEYDERLGKLVRIAAKNYVEAALIWELELFRELLAEAKEQPDASL